MDFRCFFFSRAICTACWVDCRIYEIFHDDKKQPPAIPAAGGGRARALRRKPVFTLEHDTAVAFSRETNFLIAIHHCFFQIQTQ